MWKVTDSSTNGTYINGAKIGRGNTEALHVGDKLGLSIMVPGGAASADAANTNYVNTVE